MIKLQVIDSIINNLSSDDPAVIELKRILTKESVMQEKGLRAWLVQYQREANVKVFLAPLAAYIALQLADNSLQEAIELLCPGVNLPHSVTAIPLFIKSMPHRFTKAGFTGSPVKDQNHLYAQLAWLFVDWNKSDYQEQYWKILYPELVSVYDGNDNKIWPQYGQGILVKNSKGDYQNRLINYAEVYKLAQTANGFEKLEKEFSTETLRRVYRFYPGHKEFWVNMQNKKLPESPYKNYFEFFTALQKFLYDNRYTGKADPMTKEIATDIEVTPTAQATFWSHYAPFLRGFINHVNAQTGAYKKTLESATQDLDIHLLRIVDSLLYPPQTGTASCFNKNQSNLSILLRKDESAILTEILICPKVHFERFLNEAGRDNLPSISGQVKKAQDKRGLLDLINEPANERDIGSGMAYWVAEYKRILKDDAYHIITLHDFLYQIQNKEESLDFLKTILGDPLDLSLLQADSADQYKKYAEKIIGHYPLLYQTQSINSQSINLGLKKGFAKKHFPFPIGFLWYCGTTGASIQAALSNDRLGEVSSMFDNYIDTEESTSWDRLTFFNFSRMLDLETAQYFIKYFSANLINDFLHDRYFFVFLRSFHVAGEDIAKDKSPVQDALFDIIILPSLSLYCKTARDLKTLLHQMKPYADIIFSELEHQIPSMINSVLDIMTLVHGWPSVKIDQLYDLVKVKMHALIKNSADLELVEILFNGKPVKSDFATAITQTNTLIDFRFFSNLYAGSSQANHPIIIGIIKNTPLTEDPRFIINSNDIFPAIQELSTLAKQLSKEDFQSLILYYQKGISKFLCGGTPSDLFELITLISERVWSIFYKLFQEEIQSFSQRFLKVGIDFDMSSKSYNLSENITRLDIIFNGFALKMLALVHDEMDLEALCKMFPMTLGSKLGFAPYLYPLMTNALTIYKLLPAYNKKDFNESLARDSKGFFKEFSSNPLLKESWRIAVMPNEKQRRNAVCSLFDASPGSSSTSSIVRFSPNKIKAIVAATASPPTVKFGYE